MFRHHLTCACLLACSIQTISLAAPTDVLAELTRFVDVHQSASAPNAEWSQTPLSKDQASQATEIITNAFAKRLKTELQPEWDSKSITAGGVALRFDYRQFGDKPQKGRSLYISMHGGGSTTAQVNDQQWRNQIRLYEPKEGIYVAPRAPTDSWNMWHQSHIDTLFDRLITAAIVCADIDPNSVYIMGYSAGGDGVYQLAPRMADRFAAAAMMAGHPNDAKPDGLRNLPFAIHMGANDSAFKRNDVAREWGVTLDALRAADTKGYPHTVTLHEGKGHWMDRQDAVAIPWMASHSRTTLPDRIVWMQASTTHDRFYWVSTESPQAGSRLDISRDANNINIDPSTTVEQFILLVNDDCFDLEQPIRISGKGIKDTSVRGIRTIHTIWTSLHQRFDPGFVPTSRVKVVIEKAAPSPAK